MGDNNECYTPGEESDVGKRKMSVSDILGLAGQFGPMGLFVSYLVWREQRTAAATMAYNQARLECDKALASSLGALTAVIQRLDR